MQTHGLCIILLFYRTKFPFFAAFFFHSTFNRRNKSMSCFSTPPMAFLPTSIPLPTFRSTKCFCLASSNKWKPIVTSDCLLTPTSTERRNSPPTIHLGPLLAAATLTIVDYPAFAVTGSNNYEYDLNTILIQSGIAAVWYFLVMPPIVLNWLRLRWYKRKFFEMYLQFMFVFLFFPGILLWAPFLNFRRMPRDASMKYPWSTPQDASTIDNL